jgi:2-(1,2-epoxy-1,2-dihydrophenyl)acetyl-CoA isomerase
MSQDHLITSLDRDGIFTITLNRPQVLNALNPALLRELREAAYRALVDIDVKVVVITATGRAFCAGGDVTIMSGASDPGDPLTLQHCDNPAWNDLEPRIDRINQFAEAPMMLHTMGKPTIAVVRGPVAGAGMSLATACDFRIASETAMFTSAFAKIGASGDYGGSYFVTKLVGPAKAREIYYFSDRLDAQECLRIGLVNWLVADDVLEEEAMTLARRLAKGPPLAYRGIKENINAAESLGMRETVQIESRNMVRTMKSEDGAEARQAFLEKRSPIFSGR